MNDSSEDCRLATNDGFDSNFNNSISAYTDVKKEDEKNRVDCDGQRPEQYGKVCRVDVSNKQFGICTKEKGYGFPKSSPCVFLKLNKVIKWIQSCKANFFLNFINYRSTDGIHNSTTHPANSQKTCQKI
jgi:hypothetical protein